MDLMMASLHLYIMYLDRIHPIILYCPPPLQRSPFSPQPAPLFLVFFVCVFPNDFY